MNRKVKVATLPFSRVAGGAAIGFALLIVAGNVITAPAGLPHTAADIGQVTTFFAEEGTALAFASSLIPAAWIMAVVFGAGVVAVTRDSERALGEAWSLVGLCGLVLQNAAFAVVVALRLALSVTDGQSAPAALWALHDAGFTLNGTFLALALLGMSIGGIRAGLIRGWHAGLGLVAAALLFGSATLAPLVIEHGGALGQVGLAGWLLWVVWIIIYGAALIRWTPAARTHGADNAR